MKLVQYEEPSNETKNPLPEFYRHFYPNAKLLFFDIETTGFVANHTTLYLIGALWFENNQVKIMQWFNDDGVSEKAILEEFFSFCKKFTHIVHFNGLGFDLPYLRQKAKIYKVPFDLINTFTHIDIYKKIRSYKSIFSTENLKQVSIEQYLGIKREDTYSGKELIYIYQKYIGKANQELEQLLLLHNHDDLLGMLKISKILNYTAFFENLEINFFSFEQKDEQFIINFTFNTFASLPKRLCITKNSIYLNAFEEKASIYIPIYQGELRHYFKDYKNYYYLPQEDIVIHKSIATYVDSKNKTKANKENCYTKKDGCFIPSFDIPTNESFQLSYSDKNIYQEIDTLKTYDEPTIKQYIKNILLTFL